MSDKVALYARKSREGENSTKEETLHDQMQTLINICEAKGYQYKTSDIYKEVESSIKADRPELIKLMKAMEQGKYTRLLITHIDRLGRDIGLLDDLKKLCIAYEIIIETPDNTINFKDDNHDLMYGFSSVLADFEYKRIRHRLATGKVNTVSLRNRWVGSSPPFGYEYDKSEKILKPHSEHSKVYRRMVEYMLEGYSYSEVSNSLNEQGYRTRLNNRWTPGRIQKILKNRTYLGEAEYNSTRLNKQVTAVDCHEPLVTLEEYNTIQQLSGSRRNYSSRRSWGKIKTELDGLIFCGKCKRGMTIQISKKKSEVKGEWSFYQARRCIHLLEDGSRCPNHGCKVDIILENVIEVLYEYKQNLIESLNSLESNNSTDVVDQINKKVSEVSDEIKKNDTKISRLTELYLDEVLSRDEHDKRRAKLNETKVLLVNEKKFLEEKSKGMNVEQAKKNYETIIELIAKLELNIPLHEKNKIMRLLISRIEITKDTQYENPRVKIEFNE